MNILFGNVNFFPDRFQLVISDLQGLLTAQWIFIQKAKSAFLIALLPAKTISSDLAGYPKNSFEFSLLLFVSFKH